MSFYANVRSRRSARRKKKPGSFTLHAIGRARIRYGAEKSVVLHLEKLISSKSKSIARSKIQPNGRHLVEVLFLGSCYFVIYDPAVKQLVTFLPTDRGRALFRDLEETPRCWCEAMLDARGVCSIHPEG